MLPSVPFGVVKAVDDILAADLIGRQTSGIPARNGIAVLEKPFFSSSR